MAQSQDKVFEAIHLEADAAGRRAAADAELEMLTVRDSNGTVYPPFPICGFGWVHFAGNTAWGRWAKKQGLARNDYPKGLCIWVSGYEQSYDRKLAYAQAYAKVLQEHNIDAYGTGRLD